MRRVFSNKAVVLSVVIVILLVLAGFTAGGRGGANVIRNIITLPLAPLHNAYSAVTKGIGGFFGYFGDIRATKKLNAELQIQVHDLEQKNSQLAQLEKENSALRAALDFKDQYAAFDFLGCNVIDQDAGNLYDIFTVDRGLKDGLAVDAPVITAFGLVGRVLRVDAVSSSILPIIDMESTVSARLTKTRDQVLVRGDVQLRLQGMCRVENIPPNADIVPGDTIETSGLGGVFPKGLLIGKIEKVIRNDGQYDVWATVKPMVDFKRLEEVIVLKAKTTGPDLDQVTTAAGLILQNGATKTKSGAATGKATP